MNTVDSRSAIRSALTPALAAVALVSSIVSTAAAQRAPATHLSRLRDEYGSSVRVVRAVDLALPSGAHFVVTAASYVEDGDKGFALSYGPPDRGHADDVAVVDPIYVTDPQLALLTFDVRAVPVGPDGGVHVFIEVAASNENRRPPRHPCRSYDDESYDDEDDGSYDEDLECEEPTDTVGAAALLVIDPIGNTKLLEEDLTDLEEGRFGRYRLIDDDEDGAPEIFVDAFVCFADEPSACGQTLAPGAAWDARVRELGRSVRVHMPDDVYFEPTQYCFDADARTYVECGP